MLKKTLFPVIVCTFFISGAKADYIFAPSITHYSQKLTNGTNPSNEGKITIIDMRLGYVMDMGLYIGGLYSIHDYNFLAESSDSYFGPTVGYYRNGFLAAFTYYLYGERDLSDGSGKYSSVSGFQLDFSYAIFITDSFGVGPQITYQQVKFSDFQDDGISSAADYKLSGLTPYFNLLFKF